MINSNILRLAVRGMVVLVFIWILFPSSGFSAGWTVFQIPGENNYSTNKLLNPSLENVGGNGLFVSWSPYYSGYAADSTTYNPVFHSPGKSAKVSNPIGSCGNANEYYGLTQSLLLNQTEIRPIYFGGYSKALNVSGNEDSHYSIHLDTVYMDNTKSWNEDPKYLYLVDHNARFPTGTTETGEWTYKDNIYMPVKPIKYIYYYLLLRCHTGTAWFDDLYLNEIYGSGYFDDSVVIVPGPSQSFPYEGSPVLGIASGDGLELQLTETGGAVISVSNSGIDITAAESVYASGFFIRDVKNDSDYIHFGGTTSHTSFDNERCSLNNLPGERCISYAGNAVLDTDLVIDINADFTGYGNRIEIDIELSDSSLFNGTGEDRALTLYFALPVEFTEWSWGDDIRTSRNVNGILDIHNNIKVDFGANGYISRYPFTSVSDPLAGGISLGYPLDRPAAIRLAANPASKLLYIAYDVALSAKSKQPGTTGLSAVIYRFNPEWKFRAAARKYYELYPEYFNKRVTKEGIWMAFGDLSTIADIEDFGVAFHEADTWKLDDEVAFDDTKEIYTFHYTIPMEYWVDMNGTNIDNYNYDEIMTFFNGDPQFDYIRSAVLNSGTHDENGKYRLSGRGYESWCSYCSVFITSGDPDITAPNYVQYYRDEYDAFYNSSPTMDGEYIDGLEAWGSYLDYRDTNISASDLPLTYEVPHYRAAAPVISASYEFAKWVADDVHSRGKLLMANSALWKFAFPAHLLDIMGTETNWNYNNIWSPMKDGDFNFKRTLSYKKPYAFLMNTDFTLFTHTMVDEYFKTSLFYGVYPNMFFNPAGGENYRYWDNSAFYERDRPLFKKYIPLIMRMNEAGWEPVTYVKSSDADIYVERYGSRSGGEKLFISTKNAAAGTETYNLSMESGPLGLPGTDTEFIDLLTGETRTGSISGSMLILEDTLGHGEVRLFTVKSDVCTDNDGDGYYAGGGICGNKDCNDGAGDINPSAVEVCDAVDNNCDGTVAVCNPTDWYDNGNGSVWDFRQLVTIQPGMTTAVDGLDNFPLLIQIHDPANPIFTQARADGVDILFTDANGLKLDHEIERFDSASGDLSAWVRLPQLTANGMAVYMYYGNDEATNQQNSEGVWDSNYVMVQHLSETSGQQHLDSTSNNNDSNSVNVAAQGTAGKIGGADEFISNTYVRIPDPGVNSPLDLAGSGPVTFSAWVYARGSGESGEGGVLAKGGEGGWANGYKISFEDQNCNLTQLGPSRAGKWNGPCTSPLPLNAWIYAVYVYDPLASPATHSVYFNSVSAASHVGDANAADTSKDFKIGEYGTSSWDGFIDEVRISNIARSAAWIQAEYNNQNSPESYIHLATQEVYCTDSDGDGYSADGGLCGVMDCNDSDAGIYPGGPPVRVAGGNNNYLTLQGAYDAAADGSTIELKGGTLTENLYLNLNKTLTLTGGYDCGYSSVTGKTTVIGNVTISSGKVTVENLEIQ